MTIYEIDEAIQKCIDTETGEVNEEALNSLLLERDTKIEQLACWVIDLEAATKAISEQQQVLGKRKEAALHKADSIRQYIAAALAGQKFALSVKAQLIDNLMRFSRETLQQERSRPIRGGENGLPLGFCQ